MTVNNAILQKHFEKYGFDSDFFENYETEATDEMQNVDSLCDRLNDIQKNKQKIVIYTDFDVDGIMSSVIAYAGLSELGFNVALFKPTPSDGYGFRTSDVDNICNMFPDVRAILTGDVGISCNEAIEYAKGRGLAVFVTDHHIGTCVCSADITVNPNQFGETYSHGGICGSYVLYKVIERYASKYGDPTIKADIYRLQMFAGIATVSDVMPLLYENRPLVRNSVAIMRYYYNYELSKNNTLEPPVYSKNYMKAFVGMKKLLEYFTQKRKIRKSDDISEQFYGFYLVPFLNSVKRMEGDMRGVYDIFFSDYVSPADGFPNMSCVENGIKYVETLSDRRKELTAQYFAELLTEKEQNKTENSKYMQSNVYITDAASGLLGLLGAKFISLTDLPVLVLNRNDDGSYSGSGRNPSWFDFWNRTSDYGLDIIRGGHGEAFGVLLPDKATLDKYVEFYNNVVLPEYVKLMVDGAMVSRSISVSYKGCADCDFMFDSILIKEFLTEKERFHPYGKAFPEPRFDFYIKLDGVSVEDRMFGSENQHVKLITEDGMELLLFNMALDLEKLKYDNKDKDYVLICSGTFCYDEFNRTEYDTINFLVNDIDVLCSE